MTTKEKWTAGNIADKHNIAINLCVCKSIVCNVYENSGLFGC